MMGVNQIIDFLGTNSIWVTFSPKGLKHLSFYTREGAQQDTHQNTHQDAQYIDLEQVGMKKKLTLIEKLLIKETSNFLETGKHTMPLDLSDFTNFQQSVFKAVGKVTSGRVITYKGIAEMLGKPGAAQAVSKAIAQNPVSYFLPTHRVIPQKGMLICRHATGRFKEKLLTHEGHDLDALTANTVCTRKTCNME